MAANILNPDLSEDQGDVLNPELYEDQGHVLNPDLYEDEGEEIEDQGSPPRIERNGLYSSIWELLKSNQENEKGGERSSGQSIPSIYEVPPKLRKENESAYSPRLISIGPIHRDTSELKDMDKHKLSYMQSLFSRTNRLVKNSNKKSSHQRRTPISHQRRTPVSHTPISHQRRTPESRDHVYQIMKGCVDSIIKEVPRARACYQGSLKPCDDGEFAQMLLFDGCFIIELVYRSKLPQKLVGDPILGNTLVLIDIRHDLLLLENQIPWFVLDELFKLTIGKIQDQSVFRPLARFVLDFFGNVMNFQRPITKKVYPTTIDHILDLLHQCYRPPHTTHEDHDLEEGMFQDDQDGYQPNYVFKLTGLCAGGKVKVLEDKQSAGKKVKIPEDNQIDYSATTLDNVGINFHAGKGEVIDIDFSISCWFSFLCGAGIPENPTCYVYNPTKSSSSSCLLPVLCRSCGINRFEISPLCLHDSTESFLRNLIAYEQCKPGVEHPITSYVFLMHTIISSKEDVELLVKAKVLENNLGESEDVLNLFNKMCKEVVLGEFCFSKPWKVVHEYCKRYKRRNLPSILKRNCASLTNYYFNSRWAVISIIAALILFALQVLQTIYTLRSSK
ncbi:hypothetical protein LguiB_026569 [Lonicera macranthoides]